MANITGELTSNRKYLRTGNIGQTVVHQQICLIS